MSNESNVSEEAKFFPKPNDENLLTELWLGTKPWRKSAGELVCKDWGSCAAACVARVITQLIFKGPGLL